jgi:hypothetical protein
MLLCQPLILVEAWRCCHRKQAPTGWQEVGEGLVAVRQPAQWVQRLVLVFVLSTELLGLLDPEGLAAIG